MKALRTTAIVLSGLALALSAGCGPSAGGDGPTPPRSDALAGVDPCSILTPQDLGTAGLRPNGSPQSDVATEPGCYYSGRAMTVTTYKNVAETVESSATKPDWAKFDRFDLNGRPAATSVSAGSTQAQICSTMFDSGKGMIRVSAHMKRAGNEDACQKSQEIAKQIEPRMPKKQ